MKKPIKVGNGEFVTDSNFDVMYFTQAQVRSLGRQCAKRMTNGLVNNTYKFKFKGVRDCGEYWTYTIQ